jgi:hypothetical protein
MMFLSKTAITKQLFYEFLNFKKLALAPGQPVQMEPGTLLGSAVKADLSLLIGIIENRLKTHLAGLGASPAENEAFDESLSSLIAYKKAAHSTNNPFTEYAESEATTAHPCAWLAFAPLLLDSSLSESSVTFETKQQLVDYLNNSKVAFKFAKNSLLNETGLYIAVQTNNHEMVDAFLCPEFYGYKLTKKELIKLLSLTRDPKTRMALFRHCKGLIDWINTEKYLQKECIKSVEELSNLWSFLNPSQREGLINNTHSQLWLNLLDSELAIQKITKLLGANFKLLNNKIMDDLEIKSSDLLPKNLQYLSHAQHFNYLVNSTDLKKLMPLPRGKEWFELLATLGYHVAANGKLTTTRYLLLEPISQVHNHLVKELIALPIETKIIIEALQKIEAYVHDQSTVTEYKECLQHIAKNVVDAEYETEFFLINWINKLLRFLNIKSQSPLHPYLDKLVQSAHTKLIVIPGDIINIIAPVTDYNVYKEAISAYLNHNINEFWQKLSPQDRKKIISDPIRFETLLHSLYSPDPNDKRDDRNELFTILDDDSLKYFNTPEGLLQLVLDTPSFNPAPHLSILIDAMKHKNIIFLEEANNVVALLVAEKCTRLEEIYPFLPLKLNNADDLRFQEAILSSLPKPLQKEPFNRFLEIYCKDPHHFSNLMQMISDTKPFLASTCWDNVSDTIWSQWYAQLEHAEAWSKVFKHLSPVERLEFFEKLSSGNRLDAEEFCDFLAKNKAVFPKIWDQIPQAQWDTWIKNKLLPATTLSLLNTMPYPLRVDFFKAMLQMKPQDLANLCVTPDKTVEQFYSQEVLDKIAHSSTPSV